MEKNILYSFFLPTFVAEMQKQNNHKELIDKILIKEKRYCDPNFSAKQLAEMLGVTPYKLSKILQTEFGKSYADIVHSHRIEDAVRLFQDKRFDAYTVDDIGFMVGYRNRQSFFTAFKNFTRQTPKHFRKM